MGEGRGRRTQPASRKTMMIDAAKREAKMRPHTPLEKGCGLRDWVIRGGAVNGGDAVRFERRGAGCAAAVEERGGRGGVGSGGAARPGPHEEALDDRGGWEARAEADDGVACGRAGRRGREHAAAA